AAVHGLGRDQAGQTHHIGHGQVEGGAEDDQRLPDGDESEHAHYREDVADVAGAEEAASRRGDEHCADDEDQHERDVDECGGVESAQSLPPCSSTPRASVPVASPSTSSSLALGGSCPAIRPSDMTRSRSDMPRTSGSSLETRTMATPAAASLRMSR